MLGKHNHIFCSYPFVHLLPPTTSTTWAWGPNYIHQQRQQTTKQQGLDLRKVGWKNSSSAASLILEDYVTLFVNPQGRQQRQYLLIAWMGQRQPVPLTPIPIYINPVNPVGIIIKCLRQDSTSKIGKVNTGKQEIPSPKNRKKKKRRHKMSM